MEDSIFTKIIKGEIPSHKIYEDELTLAFLDIHPKIAGHTLVVPKTQVEFLWDLSDEDYIAVTTAVKKVANRLQEVLGSDYIGEQVIGLDVPHAHVHVFPFANLEQYLKLGDQNSDPDHTALAELAKKLAF